MTDKDSTKMILRKADNAYIPLREGNSDYADYLKWVADGNTPEASS